MEDNWITSVGIDLGTSTTKLIFSRLRIVRTSPNFALPHYQIIERRLIYRSPIYQTPLLNGDLIDMDAASEILNFEYKQAGISFSDISSGAIIITGETATKQNANQVVHYLAERGGDFVVATAGADLEGILAGKGSGAQERSTKTDGIIANIDIGGGTANVVLFEHGNVIDTFTFHVGGRLIEIHKNGTVLRISPHLLDWLKQKGHTVSFGDQITYQQLFQISLQLSRSIFCTLAGYPLYKDELLLLGKTLGQRYSIKEVMISGGIGLLMAEKPTEHLSEALKYGDIGPLLADAIRCIRDEFPFLIFQAPQTQHATVIGAGMQITEISGGTVFANAALLPLRNVPVIQMELPSSMENWSEIIEQVIAEGEKWFLDQDETSMAFALSGIQSISYQSLSKLADEFACLFSKKFLNAQSIIIVCQIDMAKALGQAIALRCRDGPPIICIDQISVEHGDYIDLGMPLDGEMIPVVIKTLVFPKHEDGVNK